jgi:hypothetical protein
VKEAGLQKPVLTNRNYIRGCIKRISRHTTVKSQEYKKVYAVDIAVIGQRETLLPGEIPNYENKLGSQQRS